MLALIAAANGTRFLLVPSLGSIGATLAFTASGIFTFFVHSVSCHSQLSLSLPWLTIIRISLATILMGIVVMLGIQLGISWIIMSSLIAPLVYGALLFILKIVRTDELRTLAGASSSRDSASNAAPLAMETSV